MNEEQAKELFINGAKQRLADLRQAMKEVEKQINSDNDNAIKLGVAWTQICHDFMLQEAVSRAMVAIREKPVYPH